MVKTFINCGVLVLTAIGSMILFNFIPTLSFVCGAVTIMCSIFLYHDGGDNKRLEPINVQSVAVNKVTALVPRVTGVTPSLVRRKHASGTSSQSESDSVDIAWIEKGP